MKNKIKLLITTTATIIFIVLSQNLLAQGKSITRIETQEKQAYNYYNKGDYKQACDIFIKTTKQRTNIEHSKIEQTLIFFFLVDCLGLFIFMYLEKQRAYKKLVNRNIECANRPIIIANNLNFDSKLPDDDKDKKLLQDIQQLFEEEKIYLNKDLSTTMLAKRLNINKNNLSKIVNKYLNKTFPELINAYRINEAIKLLTDSKTNNYKMEVISDMCGYNNRQVFHSAFKKETGLTPNDFRKMSLSKNEE